MVVQVHFSMHLLLFIICDVPLGNAESHYLGDALFLRPTVLSSSLWLTTPDGCTSTLQYAPSFIYYL
jgi:hypothetical protein